MPRPPGPLRQSRVPLRAQTVESLGRLLGGEKLYYRREYDAKHNERLPQHPSQPLLGSKLFRRVRISRSVHLLRLVMAWLCAKRPLKDIRTRAAKAKNVCVILAGSRRFLGGLVGAPRRRRAGLGMADRRFRCSKMRKIFSPRGAAMSQVTYAIYAMSARAIRTRTSRLEMLICSHFKPRPSTLTDPMNRGFRLRGAN